MKLTHLAFLALGTTLTVGALPDWLQDTVHSIKGTSGTVYLSKNASKKFGKIDSYLTKENLYRYVDAILYEKIKKPQPNQKVMDTIIKNISEESSIRGFFYDKIRKLDATSYLYTIALGAATFFHTPTKEDRLEAILKTHGPLKIEVK